MVPLYKNKLSNLFVCRKNLLIRKANFSNLNKFFWTIFKFVLLCGLSFIIIFPFIVKLSSMFMSSEDTYDNTVAFLPKHPTFNNINFILEQTYFLKAILSSLLLSLMVAVFSTVMAAFVGYGLAKFKFKGSSIVFGLVIFTLLVPPSTILIPMYIRFRYFDILGIINLISGNTIKLTDTPVPLIFLSITGLGFRGGLYIMIMRQIFKGIPNELSEAASVDGMDTFGIFRKIMIPLGRPMLIVVFLFSFCWQWTDTFYTSTLYSKIKLLPNIISTISSMNVTNLGQGQYATSILLNTVALMAVLPLLIMFIFVQKKFVQGIESSGIVG